FQTHMARFAAEQNLRYGATGYSLIGEKELVEHLQSIGMDSLNVLYVSDGGPVAPATTYDRELAFNLFPSVEDTSRPREFHVAGPQSPLQNEELLLHLARRNMWGVPGMEYGAEILGNLNGGLVWHVEAGEVAASNVTQAMANGRATLDLEVLRAQ